jgi:hypothetical protein
MDHQNRTPTLFDYGQDGRNISTVTTGKDAMDTYSQIDEHYRRYRPRRKLKPADRKAIAARHKDGYTVKDMCDAIDGMFLDEFYLGKNNRGRAYDRIDIALRESNIDAFIDKATEHQESQDRKKRERIEKIEQEAEQARQADEYRKRGMSAQQALKQAMNRH